MSKLTDHVYSLAGGVANQPRPSDMGSVQAKDQCNMLICARARVRAYVYVDMATCIMELPSRGQAFKFHLILFFPS